MEYRLFASHKELKNLKPFFKRSIPAPVIKWAERFLERLGNVFGFTFGVEVTPELADYPPETWEVLEVINKLQKLGIATSFYFTGLQYPDEPKSHTFVVKISGDQRLGHSGTGKHLFEKAETVWPAVGEALERWALDTFEPEKGDYIDSSYANLKDSKLDIFSIAGFTEEFRKRGHPDYKLEVDKDTVFRWTKGFSLTQNKETHIPLQLVSFSHSRKLENGNSEPLLSPPMTTGAATGQTLEHALVNGILEVVERDAFMIYWLNKIPADIIDIASIPDERFAKLGEILDRYNLEVYPLYLKTDAPVHVVLNVVIDRTGIGPAVIVGAHVGFDLVDVVHRAVSASLSARSPVRKMAEQNTDSLVDRSLSEMDHSGRMLYWCQKKKIEDIGFFINGRKKQRKEFPSYNAPIDYKGQLEYLKTFFRDSGYEVAYKDLLNKKLQKELKNLRTVMVRIPEFQPLYLEEGLRCFGGKRLREIPEKLGIKPAEKVNKDPHPFP